MKKSPSEGAEDHAYFQAVEKVFIELRGAPLLLSPADWRIAQTWRNQGIPLRLVASTLQEVFEKREREGKGKVQGLRYLKPAVKRAWKLERELVLPGSAAPAEAPEMDSRERLRALSKALGQELPERSRWSRRIRELAGSAEEIEGALAELDGQILASAAKALGTEESAELEAELAKARAALASRLPVAEVDAASDRLRERLLRRRLGLPVLSLFAPEAEAPASGSEALREDSGD